MSHSEPMAAVPQETSWMAVLAGLFHFDILHVRQRVFTLAEKYEFTDEAGAPRFFVVRPPRLAINLLAGLFFSFLRLGLLIFVVVTILRGGPLLPLVALLIVANFFLTVAHILVAPYRDIQVFSDESQSWRLLTITQDNKIGLTRDYTVYDCLGNAVARLRRQTLPSIFRATWEAETLDGHLIGRVREDSLVRALLRRYLGPLYGILRTNFNFEFPDGTVCGKFDRKLTLTDQYLLDLRGDPRHLLDRRVALAAAILLDTGEAR
ncbi:MAG: hypothetical protein KF858_09290 [Candidatus Sumerlaeia bacterium]|nr:hypothetical protein [Candidatus Sumerlaeia bacterium]